MAEELKCTLMSTPKFEMVKTQKRIEEDKLQWTPGHISSPDNLRGHTQGFLHEAQGWSDADSNTNNHPWEHCASSPPYYKVLTPSSISTSPSGSPSTSCNFSHPYIYRSKLFGTPSCPSSLDQVCAGQREKAAQLGIPEMAVEASFEGNQSFSKATQLQHKPDFGPGNVTTCGSARPGGYHKTEDFRGEGMNDISFSINQPRKKYFPQLKDVTAGTGNRISSNKSLNESWSFFGFLGSPHNMPAFPSTVRNPNKAICTIIASSSEILTANDMACELFGYEEDQLVGRPLKDLLRLKSKEQEVVKETHLEVSGQLISLAGKVVEALDSSGMVLPVSLWVKCLDKNFNSSAPDRQSPVSCCQGDWHQQQQSRLLCVMEPVQRTVGHLQFDSEGEIQWCDDSMAQLCGYLGPHQMCGLHMQQIIPAFLCPEPAQGLTKEIKKQRATGRTRDGVTFPLSIVVQPADDVEDIRWIPPNQDEPGEDKKHIKANTVYQATVWVFANISGMLTLRPNGTIHSINESFARLLFGYKLTELVGHSISKLIPDFFNLLEMELNSFPLSTMDDEKEERDSDEKNMQESPGKDEQFKDTRCSMISPLASLVPASSTSSGPNISNLLCGKSGHNKKIQQEQHYPSIPAGMRELCSPLYIENTSSFLPENDNKESIDRNNTNSNMKTEKTIDCDCSSPVVISKHATVCSDGGKVGAISMEGQVIGDPDAEICSGNSFMRKVSQDIDCKTEYLKSHVANDPKDQFQCPVFQGQDTSNPGVSGCEDVKKTSSDCDIMWTVHGEAMPKPVTSDYCALSPIKHMSPTLENSDEDTGDTSYISDTTDLLTPSIPACEISDLVWSEGEGQGDNLSQGVVADISGNMDDTLNLGKDTSVPDVMDGRKSRLSCSWSFRSRVVSGGLGSSSTISDDSGPVDEKLMSVLPCHSPESFHHENGSSGDMYLEDESSYFCRDGTSLSRSNPSTDSSHSCSRKGLSSDNNEMTDLSTEGMPHKDAKPLISNPATPTTSTYVQPSQGSSSLKGGCAKGHIPDGCFSGLGRHKDGGSLGVVFQIRRITLTDGSEMLMLWLSRDPDDVCDTSRSHGNLTLASSFSSTLDQSHHSLGELLQEQANSESKLEDIKEMEPQEELEKLPSSLSLGLLEKNEDSSHRDEVLVASAGEYNKNYVTLSSIGKGAFGFVRLARRRLDNAEMVVKFIRRAKVLRESWVKDSHLGVVPMEVFLLSRLHHPNIVKVEDVFQNDSFIQLVMERHGSGMDVFEFIDRNPHLDEPLTSYIFRQMVSGVSYLHSQNIVHRDIKDENIIIDEHFNIKLIDFGAATYMVPGRMFSTFCGTIEYCSPEVLMGNKYHGPELEMWSLGITLYTLIFGENPFFDIEETLEGVLKPPSRVSRALMFLITWLLHPDPLCRATIADVERNAWVNQPVDPSQYHWDVVLPNSEFHGNTACDNRESTPDNNYSDKDKPDNISSDHDMADCNHNMDTASDDHQCRNSNGITHHNCTPCKASHNHIADIVTGFNRLLQMPDSLDTDLE